jgi:hypothetical protein
LLKQDWFKKDQDNLQIAQKQFSRSAEKIKGWDGYSSKGQAVYDSMFEAEKAIITLYLTVMMNIRLIGMVFIHGKDNAQQSGVRL